MRLPHLFGFTRSQRARINYVDRHDPLEEEAFNAYQSLVEEGVYLEETKDGKWKWKKTPWWKRLFR